MCHLAADANKSGMTAENVAAAARAGKQLTRQEAEQILGIEPGATWEEISKVRSRVENLCIAVYTDVLSWEAVGAWLLGEHVAMFY